MRRCRPVIRDRSTSVRMVRTPWRGRVLAIRGLALGLIVGERGEASGLLFQQEGFHGGVGEKGKR